MNRKNNLLILVVVFALLLVGAYVLYDRLGSETAPQQLMTQDTQPPEATGEEVQSGEATTSSAIAAPDFTVYDRDGNAVRLSDYTGKPVVLNFWASWCGPCQMEMPDFDEKHRALSEDVQFLMVNMTDGSRETVESAAQFIENSGYTFPVFYDTQLDAASAYGVYSLPTTYFIDAEGNLITRAMQAIDGETLQIGIDMILP